MKLIQLTQGKFAKVDDQDFAELSKFKWQFRSGYAVRTEYVGVINGKQHKNTVWMHRSIMNTPKGMETDHKNHDRIDNRKKNLRICTTAENQCNTTRSPGASGFRGVYKYRNRYKVQIQYKKKLFYFGVFSTKEEAVIIRDIAAKELHGEFAVLNKV